MDSNDNRNWAGGRFRDNNDKFDPNKFYMMRGHTLRTVLNCIEELKRGVDRKVTGKDDGKDDVINRDRSRWTEKDYESVNYFFNSLIVEIIDLMENPINSYSEDELRWIYSRKKRAQNLFRDEMDDALNKKKSLDDIREKILGISPKEGNQILSDFEKLQEWLNQLGREIIQDNKAKEEARKNKNNSKNKNTKKEKHIPKPIEEDEFIDFLLDMGVVPRRDEGGTDDE